MEDQPVNGTETEVHKEAMADQQEQQAHVQVDPEVAAQISEHLQAYVDKLKETESPELIDMVVLNIQFENLRRTMAMSGAPAPLMQEYMVIMQASLDMIGFLIKVDELGAERFVSLRQDVIAKGDEITKAAMAGA